MEMKDIFDLIDKFNDSELSELRYKTTDESISLRKGHEPQFIQAPAMMAPMSAMPGDSQSFPSVNTDAREVRDAATPSSEGGEIITAPIVGTFYRSPAPDSPPFADEGSTVKAGTTICIIEAMKVMNELEADYDMEIVKILVENGAMVEYGTPLIEVKRI